MDGWRVYGTHAGIEGGASGGLDRSRAISARSAIKRVPGLCTAQPEMVLATTVNRGLMGQIGSLEIRILGEFGFLGLFSKTGSGLASGLVELEQSRKSDSTESESGPWQNA